MATSKLAGPAINFMKQIFFIIIIFFSPLVVQAVKQAPGQVPIFEPLLPPPVGQEPNYSGNVRSGPGAIPTAEAIEQEAKDTGVSVETVSEKVSEIQKASTENANSNSKGSVLLIFLIIVVIIVAIILSVRYISKQKY
jgi:hypothetical protein